jgi:hypothetical protein
MTSLRQEEHMRELNKEFYSESLKRRNDLEDKRVDERVLNWILKQ